MKNIETKIIINSSANQVFQKLMNFKSYPSWNPFITAIEGNPAIGNQLRVAIQPPDKSAMTFTPIVLKNAPNQEFRWKGKLGVTGIFDGEHYFILNALSPTQTELTHGENFSGLLTIIVFEMMKESTKQGFELMNESLKSHLEKH